MLRTLKLVLLIVLVLAMALIVLQNQAPMQIHFLWLTGEVSGIVLLFLTIAAGIITGITAALLVKRGGKPKQ